MCLILDSETRELFGGWLYLAADTTSKEPETLDLE